MGAPTANTKSFLLRTTRIDRAVEAIARHCSLSRKVGIVFICGELAAQSIDVARAVAVAARDTQWLIVSAHGVLTEEGEIESTSGLAGMSFPVSASLELNQKPDQKFGTSLIAAFRENPGSTTCVLLRTDQGDEGWLAFVQKAARDGSFNLFGGGTLPGQALHLVTEGRVESGAAARLTIHKPMCGRILSSSACRLVSHLGIVTRSRGPVVHEIDNVGALTLLSRSTEDLDKQLVILLAIAGRTNPLSEEGRTLALRAIRGVDPGRDALIMADHFPVGTAVAFAVRDAHAAKSDLQNHLRSLNKTCAGAAPGFGLFINCAGRGMGLYERPDVDTRVISKNLPRMPFVGLQSTFELAPQGNLLVPQIYAGILGVFSRPS